MLPEPTTDQRLGRWVASQFLSKSIERSLGEAVAIALVLSLGVYVSTGGQTAQQYLQVLVIGPLCAMYFAGRMRLSSAGLAVNLPFELAYGMTLTALVTVLAALVTIPEALALTFRSHVTFVIFLGVWTLGAFGVFRALAYLWPVWVRMRRSRLRWEMTHNTLMVVAPVAAVSMLLFVIVLLSTRFVFFFGPTASLIEQFMAFLPLLGILIFLTVVGLVVLLPPAALISYFAARNTASRLEALSHGTSGLREGNFAVRVHVDGEDEVSNVQRDFNAMADNLERTVADLRSERDNVERLLKTQRELVASVSHELRTPVATMRGYLEAALDGQNAREPEALKDDLGIMSREVIRLQRLIDDLFILSRAEAGQLPLDIQPADVAALVSRSVAAVAESAWRTGRVEVIEEVEQGLPLALVDIGRLEQAVRNLLANAVRHTPPGGIVALSARAGDNLVVVEVRDTGPGIPEGDQEHIFERFYRLDDARQRDPTGAGLGLAVVKELTEAMGGTVSVESEPGAGSRFILRLPRA